MRNTRAPIARRKTQAGSGKKRVVLMLYAIWVACVLMASAGYLAETATRKVVGDREYQYHPEFDDDGEVKHYVVQRADPSEDADIQITFRETTRVVEVQSTNIIMLTVDCQKIARDKHTEILGYSYENDQDYMDYFVDMERLTVNSETDEDMTITWEHMPVPVLVTEDGEEHGFKVIDDSVEIDVPGGSHTVVLYFTVTAEFPTAAFTIDHEITAPGIDVKFDSTESSAADGKVIDRREWDFGDGTDIVVGNEEKVTHSFASPDDYEVTLTVRDEDGLKDSVTHVVEVTNDLSDALDLDGDGKPDWADNDDDGDGTNDGDDDFPRDPLETTDTDNDGEGDNSDSDIDGDGVLNDDDEDPYDASVGEIKAATTDDDEPDYTLLLLFLIIIIVVALVAVMMMRSKAAKARAAKAPPTRAPARARATPGADLGFTPPPSTRALAPTPVIEAMEPVETLEPVEEVSALEAGPPKGGPYDTAGMGRDEYLDSMDGILRDEFTFTDKEVETLMTILEEELP